MTTINYYIQCDERFQQWGAVVYRSANAARRDYLKNADLRGMSRSEKTKAADEYVAALQEVESSVKVKSGYHPSTAELFETLGAECSNA